MILINIVNGFILNWNEKIVFCKSSIPLSVKFNCIKYHSEIIKTKKIFFFTFIYFY